MGGKLSAVSKLIGHVLVPQSVSLKWLTSAIHKIFSLYVDDWNANEAEDILSLPARNGGLRGADRWPLTQ